MELKPTIHRPLLLLAIVLIVPFMELKPAGQRQKEKKRIGLNRTFYGIETS